MKNESLRLVKGIHFSCLQICHLLEGSTRSRYSIIMSISLDMVTSTNKQYVSTICAFPRFHILSFYMTNRINKSMLL